MSEGKQLALSRSKAHSCHGISIAALHRLGRATAGVSFHTSYVACTPQPVHADALPERMPPVPPSYRPLLRMKELSRIQFVLIALKDFTSSYLEVVVAPHLNSHCRDSSSFVRSI